MIVVENIEKSFEGVAVLKGISAQFEKGKTNLIIGQSGSGKTVFLKFMLGLLKIDSGSIFFDGQRLKEMDPKQRISWLRQASRICLKCSRCFSFIYSSPRFGLYGTKFFRTGCDSVIAVLDMCSLCLYRP